MQLPIVLIPISGKIGNQENSPKTSGTALNELSKDQSKQNEKPAPKVSRKRKCNNSNNPAFFTWNLIAATVKSRQNLDIHRDEPLTTQLSTEKFPFKPEITSL